MAHTPGPWTARSNWRGELFVSGPEGEEDRICNAPLRRGEGYSNVRLIAAAPDLLAVCKRILNHPMIRLTGDVEAPLRAAVDKAEGRS